MTEFALFQIEQELLGIERQRGGQPVEIVALLGSVQDEPHANRVLQDILAHRLSRRSLQTCAAGGIKRSRAFEQCLGHMGLGLYGADHGVENFVLVSTDKAVRPTNIMGASKRLAELVLQAFDHEQRNLGVDSAKGGNAAAPAFRWSASAMFLGLPAPLFRFSAANRNGGPITLTHPEVTRFFMTIPEAAQLVIQAGAMARGGDVFLLDMGEPVRVADLARRMVALSGLSIRDESNPDGDIEIEVRPSPRREAL